MDKIYKILGMNLGSSSTKLVYYENENCIVKENLIHPADELRGFATIWLQYDYRKAAIEDFCRRHGINAAALDAVVTRGGHSEPLDGGVWRITEKMQSQSESEMYGVHATDLGVKIAYTMGPPAYTVDTANTDEFEPFARYSGHPLLPRRCSFHALNQRAVGKQYARDIGASYESLNLIVAHMGGGITIGAHKKGRVIDVNNGLDGDGPFSTNRTGSLPVGALVKLCYSGKYTYSEARMMLNGKGGMMAYVDENDALTVERGALAGDKKAREVLGAMCYQVGKEIAAQAAALKGEVDAILLTGGMANSNMLIGDISAYVSFIAPIVVYPGELEMQSLALHTLAALRGEIKAKEMV